MSKEPGEYPSDIRCFFTWLVYDLRIDNNGIPRYQTLPTNDYHWQNFDNRIHVVYTNVFKLTHWPRREWERAALSASKHFNSVHVVVSEKKPMPEHREGKVRYKIQGYECYGDLCKPGPTNRY